MNAKEKQQELERFAFNAFARVCPLPVLLNSIASPDPPEPDILCRLEPGDVLAFELVSVEDVIGVDKNGKPIAATKKDSDAVSLYRAIQVEYSKAVASGRFQQPERFEGFTIDIQFHSAATSKQHRSAVPRAIQLLNELGPGQHTINKNFIQSIDCERHFASITEPIFLQDSSSYYVANSTVTGIRRKLEENEYKTDHKIHLLAWSQTASRAELGVWKDDLVTLLQNGMAPFDRVWVFGLGKSSIVFDSAVDMPPR